MNVHFTSIAWHGFSSWRNDAAVFDRINLLIDEVRNTPFTGTGKPEPLPGNWSGWWSRRVTREHRLICQVRGKDADQYVIIAKCRDHY